MGGPGADGGSGADGASGVDGRRLVSDGGGQPDGYPAASAPPVPAVDAVDAALLGAGAPPCAPVLGAAGMAGGLSGVVGANAVCPLTSGSRVMVVPFLTLKYAHVLSRPSRASSSGPLTAVSPREPSTSAATIRGDTPRLSTSIPRNEPLTSPPSRVPAEAKLMLTFQLEDFVS